MVCWHRVRLCCTLKMLRELQVVCILALSKIVLHFADIARAASCILALSKIVLHFADIARAASYILALSKIVLHFADIARAASCVVYWH